MFIKLKLFGMLLSAALITTEASPLARIHVKFSQPPHEVQEHAITTDGGRLVSQQSFLSVGERSPPISAENQPRSTYNYPINPGQFHSTPTQQLPLFAPLVTSNDISYDGERESSQSTPDFSNGLDYPDPQLLTGDAAMMAVKYIYSRGGLFFHEIPHVRSLLRNQQERRENGLNGNILSSLRPSSPWFRRD